jgi:hypothetical protein
MRFRNLALTCPEVEAHQFIWLILESVEEATEWSVIEGSEGEMFSSWDDAWKAGSSALREFLKSHPFNFKAKPLL